MTEPHSELAVPRNAIDWLLVYLKGIGMGAADVVPGVSGGTVAFITGIYTELVETIAQVDLRAIKLLFSDGFAAAWQHVNGNFIAVLLLGIVTSVLTLSQVIHHLLETQAILLAAFFMGLIIASSVVLMRGLGRFDALLSAMFVLGIAAMLVLANISGPQLEMTPLTIFGGGALAICAMILPGISGSFILLLLGLYVPVIAAIKSFDFSVLIIFAAGCVCGLLAFSRILSWLLMHYERVMMAFLGGVLVGSLAIIWPWQIEVMDGGTVATENVLPAVFQAQVGAPQLGIALLCALAGLILVLLLERIGSKKPA